MKVSEQWLRSFVNFDKPMTEIAEQLTMLGLEVESCTKVAPEFNQVVVAEILSAKQHPNADRLKLCTVSIGSNQESLQIVCGAANARPGLKTVLALEGAVLPGPITIKKGKIRGEESFGMMCSAKELGIADEANGIMELPDNAPVGEDFRKYWNLDESIMEIGLTPNRGDCLSIRGIARELAAIYHLPLMNPWIFKPVTIDQKLKITINAPEACPRYIGRRINDINLYAKTPLWMQLRLERSGLRCLHPIVDITNYVMLELGQPLHAFDADMVVGNIQVRYAEKGETVQILNQDTVKLEPNTLLIADDEKPLAIAGIMGGLDSAVTDKTNHIILESAYFNMASIAGRARQYGLNTDSAYRFERGIDPQLQYEALERATQLILEIAGGTVVASGEALDETYLPSTQKVYLEINKLNRYLASSFKTEEVSALFQALNIKCQTQDSDGVELIPPSYRHDLKLDVDLIEEVARFRGYEAIPFHLPRLNTLPIENQRKIYSDSIRQNLASLGYFEVITYSFINPEIHKQVHPDTPAQILKNPISQELSVMRTSLWPGLIQTALYNQNRQQNDLKLFEVGKVFWGEDENSQISMLGGIAIDSAYPEQWGIKKRALDFYDIKGDLESLFAIYGILPAITFESAMHPALHPGQSARILYEGRPMGWLGILHPSLLKSLDLIGPVALFEIEKNVFSKPPLSPFKHFSKFPRNRRDLAIVIDEEITSKAVIDVIKHVTSENLIDVLVFDVYRSPQVGKNKKSIAISLTLQSMSGTLQDETIQKEIETVVSALQNQFNAELRE